MRAAAVAVAVFISSGCATPMTTTRTIQTRRVAFVTQPTAPTALAGTTGVGLRMSMFTGVPEAKGPEGAVSFPLFQPDLSAMVKLGTRSYLGGRLAMAFPAFGAQSPEGILPAPPEAVAVDLAVGGGHDVPFTSIFGMTVSGELGLAGGTLTAVGFDRTTRVLVLPSARVALGLHLSPGAFRFYAGGTVGTSVMNEPTGTQTQTCTITCTLNETGSFRIAGVTMVGGGVRWQANAMTSLTLEGWVPLSDNIRFPLMVALTVRLGDFGTTPPAPKPLSAPPPPPDVTPEPEEAPQL